METLTYLKSLLDQVYSAQQVGIVKVWKSQMLPSKLLWHIMQESLCPGQDLFCLTTFANWKSPWEQDSSSLPVLN